MPGSYTCRRVPLDAWIGVPLSAFLMFWYAREGDWGWFALFAVLAPVVLWLTRVRVVADDAGLLVVGLVRARRFAWDQIESIGRAYGAPHYRRSEGLMAGFRTMASGAPHLRLRDGRSIRLLAIRKNPGKRVEDPVVRLSAMLQDYRQPGAAGFGLS